MEKDFDYFSEQSKNSGFENVHNQLENITKNIDLTTKYGRDLLHSKNEIMTKLIYYNRTIEDHQNISAHICEADLFKVYDEHLKQLEEKQGNIQSLLQSSGRHGRTLYKYNFSPFSSNYTISPLLYLSIPSILAWKYSLLLQLTLGTYAPQLIIGSALYSSLRRYKWLTGASKWKGAKVVRNIQLVNDNELEIESSQLFFKSTEILPLSSVSIDLIENNTRTEPFYLIKDLNNTTKYILPLDERSVVDHRLLGWLNLTKGRTEDRYDIGHLLLKGQNKLDLHHDKHLSENIENLARIKLFSEQFPDIEIRTLPKKEILQKLSTITDEQVHNYIEDLRTRSSNNQEAQSTPLIDVETVLVAEGIEREEAQRLAEYLNKNYNINTVSGLRHLKEHELNAAFSETVRRSKINFSDFNRKLNSIF